MADANIRIWTQTRDYNARQWPTRWQKYTEDVNLKPKPRLNASVIPVLTYGAETWAHWTVSKKAERKTGCIQNEMTERNDKNHLQMNVWQMGK